MSPSRKFYFPPSTSNPRSVPAARDVVSDVEVWSCVATSNLLFVKLWCGTILASNPLFVKFWCDTILLEAVTSNLIFVLPSFPHGKHMTVYSAYLIICQKTIKINKRFMVEDRVFLLVALLPSPSINLSVSFKKVTPFNGFSLIRASTPVHVNLSSILHEKSYFFNFTLPPI